MTRAEAIEKMKWVRYRIDFDTFAPEALKAIDMAIHILEQTRWIPVTKKLPEYDEDVLCCLKTGEMAVLYRDTQWEQEVWLDGGFGTGSYDVIAWMQLPQPYEPQESEDKE